jgi:histidyl-tRNA synthetase
MNVSNRKVLDGLLETAGVVEEPAKLVVMRAIDKLDRLGFKGVAELLGPGRMDESGDRTEGANLEDASIQKILDFLHGGNPGGRVAYCWEKCARATHDIGDEERFHFSGTDYFYDNMSILNAWADRLASSRTATEGIEELAQMAQLFRKAGYGSNRIRITQDIVRGLEYYTGPVFECDFLLSTVDESGKPIRFGSVGGGGRYDTLVERFTGQKSPATGFSFGVSRLYSALKQAHSISDQIAVAPVVVLVMDKDRVGDYQMMAQTLRNAGIRAEMYLGTSGMKAQMKYADRRKAPLVVIQGGDEKAKGEVQIKDLALGAELAAGIASREDYAGQRLAQYSVPEAELVAAVKKALGR